MIDLNDPMMLMFGILASAAAGGGAGFIAGTTIGKTRPATPLPLSCSPISPDGQPTHTSLPGKDRARPLFGRRNSPAEQCAGR